MISVRPVLIIRESFEDRGPWYMKLLHYYHSAI